MPRRTEFPYVVRRRTGARLFYYFKRNRAAPYVPLPGPFGSDAFRTAYEAAAKGELQPRRIGPKVTPGSVCDVIERLLKSPSYADSARETRRTLKTRLDAIKRTHAAKPIADLEPRHIRAILASAAGKGSGAYNNALRTWRQLCRFAMAEGLMRSDPTLGLPKRKAGPGFGSWTEKDIAIFRATWPSGTRERLALELLLGTGQRRSDVVRMGPQHVKGGAIDVRQQKTGATLLLPIHGDLAAELARVPKGALVFVTTNRGGPMTPESFTNWFRKACVAAGLPENRSAHGLRKAAARRLAEAGCTALEIASVTGHRSLAEVARYTRAADQKLLAERAFARLERRDPQEEE